VDGGYLCRAGKFLLVGLSFFFFFFNLSVSREKKNA